MCIVDCGARLQMMVLVDRRPKHDLELETASGIALATNEAARHLFAREVGRRFDCAMSWDVSNLGTGGNHTLLKRHKDHHVLYRQFRSSRPAEFYTLPGTTPPGETLCQIRKWRRACQSCLELCLKVWSTTAQHLSRKHLLPTKKPYCARWTAFGCNRCGRRPSR